MVRVLNRDSIKVLERVKRLITLRHQFSHTSGMQFIAGIQQQFGKIDVLPMSKSVYVSNMTPLTFDPGDNIRYSSQWSNIAATIVTSVSGMPYEDFYTPKDLVKFYQMIDNKGMYNGKRIMSEKAVEELGKQQTENKTIPP